MRARLLRGAVVAAGTASLCFGLLTSTAGSVAAQPAGTAPVAAVAAAPAVTAMMATPQRPKPNQPVVVSATLPVGSTATLSYKVMFGADVSVPFLDGPASPGGANDGHFAATIPGQDAGQLIRYRVDATNAGVAFGSPVLGDSITYQGVVVTNPAVSTKLPVLDWFMQDSVYNDLLANHREDDVQGPAVIEYDGTVYDGVEMSIRGNSSRKAAKVNWKVEMPKGYDFQMPGLPYPLGKFALQNYVSPLTDVGWNTVGAAGNRRLPLVPVRTQLNGAFWSVGRVMDIEGKEWQKAQGVSDWSIYKADVGGGLAKTSSVAALVAKSWLDKKAPKGNDDYTDVWQLSQHVDAPASPAQKAWILQNINVPEIINFVAINTIMRNQDCGWYNWFVARDTNGTGRWEMWQWDLNWTFNTPATDGRGVYLIFPDNNQNKLTAAVLAYPDFKEMYFRRLRSLADQFLTPPRYENMWDKIAAPYLPDWKLDTAKWGNGAASDNRRWFTNGLADRRALIANYTGPGKPIPASQSADPKVTISTVGYDKATGADGEYVELTNPSSTESVDISGWTIGALKLTVPSGTVLLPRGSAVFAANETTYAAHHDVGDTFVAGEFSGRFPTGAVGSLVLRAGTRVVDTKATPYIGPATPPPPVTPATLSAAPSQVVQGSSSTLRATGLQAGEGVTLALDGTGVASLTASGTGTVSYVWTAGRFLRPGSHTLSVTGLVSGKAATTKVTIVAGAAALASSKATVERGRRFRVHGSTFEPGETVRIWLHRKAIRGHGPRNIAIHIVTASSRGNVIMRFKAWKSLSPGIYMVRARGVDTKRGATIAMRVR